jgi:hypothetical protein
MIAAAALRRQPGVLAILIAALTLLAPDLIVTLLALGLELLALLTEILLALLALLALLLVELAEGGLAALLAGLILLALILVELAHANILPRLEASAAPRRRSPGNITKISDSEFRRLGAQISPASGLEGSA